MEGCLGQATLLWRSEGRPARPGGGQMQNHAAGSWARVQLWRGGGTPTEQALRQAFAAEGLQPYQWANAPGDVYGAHSHSYHKVIVVVRGSITFGFPELGTTARLGAGDRLDLPAWVAHDAVVGADGVVCLEAHRSTETAPSAPGA